MQIPQENLLLLELLYDNHLIQVHFHMQHNVHKRIHIFYQRGHYSHKLLSVGCFYKILHHNQYNITIQINQRRFVKYPNVHICSLDIHRFLTQRKLLMLSHESRLYHHPMKRCPPLPRLLGYLVVEVYSYCLQQLRILPARHPLRKYLGFNHIPFN